MMKMKQIQVNINDIILIFINCGIKHSIFFHIFVPHFKSIRQFDKLRTVSHKIDVFESLIVVTKIV